LTNKLEDMVYVRLDRELKLAIENYRKRYDVVPSRSNAIRELLQKILKQENCYPPLK